MDELQKPAFVRSRDGRVFRTMVVVSVVLHVGLVTVWLGGLAAGPKPEEVKAIQTKLVRLGQNKPEWMPRKEQPPPPAKAEPAVIAPTKLAKPVEKPPPAKDPEK